MRIDVDHGTRAKLGEEANGDAVLVLRRPVGERLALIDGLGHGVLAAHAARIACEALAAAPDACSIEALFDNVGRALRGTRGVALTVVERDGAHLTAAGVGNVALRVIGASNVLPFGVTPGILGGAVRRLRVARGVIATSFRLVLHSDGISSRFDPEVLAAWPLRDVAPRLLSEHATPHDDATVLVADVVAHARQ